MPLSSGTRLGTYEITHVLGAGGMGEVYRARDSRLGRSVAIKIILEAFGSDSDRIARFEREAKVLASINHPNIAALYGMEQAEGQTFLVMELVEGETLAERLHRGPLDVESALAIAAQIAEALEAAHEKGVIHRDLKPANIKITPDEKVKVLDFGLAKAMDTESAGGNVANSPTLSMMATNAGVVLGTAAYMSPEQAKGFPADHRSDVFSFGVVLYEMLTGRQPFQGETAPDILASVLVREPELHRISADLNPRIHELLRRCLEKSPKRRWQAIGDVRAEVEAIALVPRATIGAVSGPPKPLWRRAIPVAAAAIVAGALAAAAAWQLKPAPVRDLARFALPLSDGQVPTGGARQILAMSRDGRHLVFVANGQLYLRSLANLTPKPIQGTDGHQAVFGPAFSPDGQSVAFYALADRTLKRIAISGGSAVTICQSEENPFGLTWADGAIFFTQGGTVMRVSPDGGKPEKVVDLGTGQRVQRIQLLPGGTHLLMTTATAQSSVTDRWMTAQIVAQALATGERKTLVDGASDGSYITTGHLAYAIGGTLYAVRFDSGRLEVKGGPVPVIEGIRRAPLGSSGLAWFGVSDTGALAYIPGPASLSSTQLDVGLVDRKGQITLLKLPPGSYDNPRMSPDGRRVAVGLETGSEVAILVYDTARGGALQRSTFGGRNRFPIWTSDSTRVVFQSDREGDLGIFWQPADGSRGPERLTKAAAGDAHIPEAWSPRGDILLFNVVKGTDYALWTHSVRDGKSEAFGGVRSAIPSDAVFSPDGRWVAYASGDPGSSTVYVQPFPATGAMYQLVRKGSDLPHQPVWTPDGKEIIVNPRPGTIDIVSVTTEPAFAFGSTVTAPKGFVTGPPGMRRPFHIAPDGRIVGLITPGDVQGTTQGVYLNVVLNWVDELKARVPGR